MEQPFLAAQHRDLSLNGLYSESKAQASLAWSGQLLFHFSCLEVTFVPVWANPFWSFLELDMDTERPQIVQQVQEFGASLPTYNVSWQLHPDLLRAQLPQAVLQQGKYSRILRFISMEMAYYLSILDSKRGCGMVFLLVLGCAVVCKGVKEALRQASTLFKRASTCGYSQTCKAWSLIQAAFRALRKPRSTWKQFTAWIWDNGFELVQDASSS